MPGGTSMMDSPQFSPARRMRPLPAEDAPLEPWIPALQDIVCVAMDVMDTSISALAARPGACTELISHVQTIGPVWDEQPEWPGRGWYVRLLLAVAGLSRVVEWWEAEKGFWNFEDEDELQGGEAIRFIMGDTEQHVAQPGSGSLAASTGMPSPVRTRGMPRPPSALSSGTSSPALEPQGSRRVVSEGDRSRLAAVQAAEAAEADASGAKLAPVEESHVQPGKPAQEGINVLMELSLDGERLLYLSPAWRTVVG